MLPSAVRGKSGRRRRRRKKKKNKNNAENGTEQNWIQTSLKFRIPDCDCLHVHVRGEQMQIDTVMCVYWRGHSHTASLGPPNVSIGVEKVLDLGRNWRINFVSWPSKVGGPSKWNFLRATILEPRNFELDREI